MKMKHISVLIVDDNFAARKLLRSVLMSLGRRILIHEVEDGPTAIKQNQIGYYDIIFLDIEMPRMNGLEVLEKILADNPEQFVSIVSANANVENVKKTVELGGKGFIVKPYTTEKVNAVVDKYFQTTLPSE